MGWRRRWRRRRGRNRDQTTIRTRTWLSKGRRRLGVKICPGPKPPTHAYTGGGAGGEEEKEVEEKAVGGAGAVTGTEE